MNELGGGGSVKLFVGVFGARGVDRGVVDRDDKFDLFGVLEVRSKRIGGLPIFVGDGPD